MAKLKKTLEIRTSPHILSGYSVDTIMFNVVLALLPVTAFSVYAFGLAGFSGFSLDSLPLSGLRIGRFQSVKRAKNREEENA